MPVNKIKVDKKIEPVLFNERKGIPLTIGNDYYVSFGLNEAIPCKLVEIIEGPPKRIRIRMEDGENILFADEIGRTPEEAVINQVTS